MACKNFLRVGHLCGSCASKADMPDSYAKIVLVFQCKTLWSSYNRLNDLYHFFGNGMYEKHLNMLIDVGTHSEVSLNSR